MLLLCSLLFAVSTLVECTKAVSKAPAWPRPKLPRNASAQVRRLSMSQEAEAAPVGLHGGTIEGSVSSASSDTEDLASLDGLLAQALQDSSPVSGPGAVDDADFGHGSPLGADTLREMRNLGSGVEDSPEAAAAFAALPSPDSHGDAAQMASGQEQALHGWAATSHPSRPLATSPGKASESSGSISSPEQGDPLASFLRAHKEFRAGDSAISPSTSHGSSAGARRAGRRHNASYESQGEPVTRHVVEADVSLLSLSSAATSRGEAARAAAVRADSLAVQVRESRAYIKQLERRLEEAAAGGDGVVQARREAAEARREAQTAQATLQRATTSHEAEANKLRQQLETALTARQDALARLAAARKAAAAPAAPQPASGSPSSAHSERDMALAQAQRISALERALADAKQLQSEAEAARERTLAEAARKEREAGLALRSAGTRAAAQEAAAKAARAERDVLQKQMQALESRTADAARAAGSVRELQAEVAALTRQLRRAEQAAAQRDAPTHAEGASGEQAVAAAHASAEARRAAVDLATARMRQERLAERADAAEGALVGARRVVDEVGPLCSLVRSLAVECGVPEASLPSLRDGDAEAVAVDAVRGSCAAVQAARLAVRRLREAVRSAEDDTSAAQAQAHKQSVAAELLRTALERQASGQAPPHSSAAAAAEAAVKRRIGDAEGAAVSASTQRAQVDMLHRKVRSMEEELAAARRRVGEVLQARETSAKRDAEAFTRLHGRGPRLGALADTAAMACVRVYEARVSELEEALAQARAENAELRSGQADSTDDRGSQSNSGQAACEEQYEKEAKSPTEESVQVPSTAPSAALEHASTHAHLHLVRTRAEASRLRAEVSKLTLSLGATAARLAQTEGALETLQSKHTQQTEALQRMVDKLTYELSQRPSVAAHKHLRERVAALEAEAEAAAEAGFDRAVLQARAESLTSENKAAKRLTRPGAAAARDRAQHSTRGAVGRLSSESVYQLLTEVCVEAGVEDGRSAPGAVRTLKTAVSHLPLLQSIVQAVASIGVVSRVATATAAGALGELCALSGTDSWPIEAPLPPSTTKLPSVVRSGLAFAMRAVHQALLVRALSRFICDHVQRGGIPSAGDLGAEIAAIASSPPPLQGDSEGVAAWSSSMLRGIEAELGQVGVGAPPQGAGVGE